MVEPVHVITSTALPACFADVSRSRDQLTFHGAAKTSGDDYCATLTFRPAEMAATASGADATQPRDVVVTSACGSLPLQSFDAVTTNDGVTAVMTAQHTSTLTAMLQVVVLPIMFQGPHYHSPAHHRHPLPDAWALSVKHMIHSPAVGFVGALLSHV